MASILLPLHLLTLAFIAWNTFHADHMALAWIRGKTSKLDTEKIKKYHKRVWIGLVLMVLTGFSLFWPLREYLLSRPQFYVKMAFVITLLCNGFVIGHLQKKAFNKYYQELTPREKTPLFVSGIVSTLAWLGAALGGLFLLPD